MQRKNTADQEDYNAEKRMLRKVMSARRRQVSASERARRSHIICNRLLEMAPGSGVIAVYIATAEEIDLSELIATLSPSMRIVAPRWNAEDGAYELAEIGGGLVEGRWGILEPPPEAGAVPPEEVDLWIVPGLAFTRDGRRLGYGGGYYDRFLAAAKPSARIVAVAYDFQMLDDIPAATHDIPVDETITA